MPPQRAGEARASFNIYRFRSLAQPQFVKLLELHLERTGLPDDDPLSLRRLAPECRRMTDDKFTESARRG
ncbi:hypothetical protein ASC89_04280 [Devosia sp. Root413D1]|nr:hypothetical protein ASC89_04280 [Devosia sp. Root413D1]